MPPKKFSKTYQPLKRRGPARKTQAELWAESQGRVLKTPKDYDRVTKKAIEQACGESPDGKANPSLFATLVRVISSAEDVGKMNEKLEDVAAAISRGNARVGSES